MQATNGSDYFTNRAASANPERPAAPQLRREIWISAFRSYCVTQSSDYVYRSVLENFPPQRVDRLAAEAIVSDAVHAVQASMRGFASMLAGKAEIMFENMQNEEEEGDSQ